MPLPRHDPGVSPESEGIPDLRDSTPNLAAGEDPELDSVPGDDPSAVEDFGTTPQELFEGESLDGRLAREEPDPATAPDPGAAADAMLGGDAPGERLVEPDEGAHTDQEAQAVANGFAHDGGGFSAEELAITVDDEFGDVL
jgi:hypothetical protein